MIVAAVCARAGSKGVPGKNTRDFLGRPLMEWAVRKALLLDDVFDYVCLSTDLKVSNVPDGVTLLPRPAHLATDSAGKWEVWRHIASDCPEWHGDITVLVDIDVTRPLSRIADIRETVDALIDGPAEMAMAIGRAKMNPYFDLLEYDGNGLLHLSKVPSSPLLCRQDTPPVYRHGGIYAMTQPALAYREGIYDCAIVGHEVPWETCWSIDDEWDWKIAEFIGSRKVTEGAARA